MCKEKVVVNLDEAQGRVVMTVHSGNPIRPCNIQEHGRPQIVWETGNVLAVGGINVHPEGRCMFVM